MLYQLGAVQFEVAPVNVNEVTHKTGADFVAKDVIGAAKPLEFMGPSEETMALKGQLVPHRHMGALDGLEALKAMARSGEPQILMRGDGCCFGWQAVKSCEATETYLDASGVGRVITFAVELQAAPNGPSAAGMDAMAGALASLFG
jgi:hypothetical protein